MVALAVLIAFQARQPMVSPPMRRAWTVLGGDNTEIHRVANGVLCYTAARQAGAVSLSTGKSLWAKKLPATRADAAQSDGSIFVLLYGGEKKTPLVSLRMSDGVMSTWKTFSEEVSQVACDASRVYLLFGDGRVDALDRRTRKRTWSTKLMTGSGRRLSLSSLTAGYDKVYAGIDGPGFHCLDARTGKVLWKRNAQYGVYNPPVLTKAGPITYFSGLTLHNPANGQAIWTRPVQYLDPKAIVDEVLIAEDNGRLTGYGLRKGEILWQEPPPDPNAGVSMRGGDRPLSPSDGSGALIVREEAQKITKAGKVVWSRKPFFSGEPVYADAKYMVTNDGERLLCYIHGDYPALPSDAAARKALAEKLASDYERLDSIEIERLTKLAPFGARILVAKYAEWAKAHGRDDDDATGQGMRYYTLLTETEEVLTRICSSAETEELLKAMRSVGPKNSYYNELVRVLGRKGDPAQVIPAYVADLKSRVHSGAQSSGSWGDSTLAIVAGSSQPEAVRFMIEVLNDPKAPADWRHEAFVHLPGTGGEAGIAAVRAARAARGPISTWESNLEASLDSRSVVAEDQDSNGETWRLVHGHVLGNASDLYLQQKVDGKWSKPIFTGLYTSRTWHREEPKELRGVPVKRFLANDWIRILPNEATLRADSDGDGLSDLVEKRLGTDPAKADTDGDGLSDSVDPCPNAAPRQMGDREKIIAACVEARFFAEHWSAPAIIDIEGVKPFEMYGYGYPLLWSSGATEELAAMYDTGVNMLGFHSAQNDDKDWVKFAPDGKSADTLIRRYSGGLNGDGIAAHLIKVGDEWFVTDMRMLYVS